ncbi:hypothetical protein EDL96_09030 [Kocuria soli]|uniref:SAF domain-containing protein n=1 Tax=Kocuria soli TaxID=2485125 RepID=A0A3N3ZNW8_9MICC|nr:SAF domain-containing protein [Kocuria soli]ROZ62612.1 hypothetical protein EDL96_09030 [Kocuria soli]
MPSGSNSRTGVSAAAHAGEPSSSGRFRKPGWKEPRLLIGLGLVLASVAGTTATLALTSVTQPHVVATRDLEVGTKVTADDFRTVDVRLEGVEGSYLQDVDALEEGTVVLASVPSGQLVPSAALGAAEDLDRRPMGIPLTAALPSGTGAGDTVDLWVSERENTGRGWGEAEQVLEGAELASVDEATGTLGAGQQLTAQVLVEEGDVSDVVDALASESRITLVPHIGGGR